MGNWLSQEVTVFIALILFFFSKPLTYPPEIEVKLQLLILISTGDSNNHLLFKVHLVHLLNQFYLFQIIHLMDHLILHLIFHLLFHFTFHLYVHLILNLIYHLIAYNNSSKCSFKCSSNQIVNLIANLIVHLITYLVHLDHLVPLVHLSSYPETTQAYPNSSFVWAWPSLAPASLFIIFFYHWKNTVKLFSHQNQSKLC